VPWADLAGSPVNLDRREDLGDGFLARSNSSSEATLRALV
jgi:hypothetical protein